VPDASLRITDLVAGYGLGVVLEQASLTIEAGERVALVGRNGAGKTTLLKSIMGLLRARSGTITFEGQSIARLPSSEIARRGIGYVPQGREIFTELTVDENLLLGNLRARDAREAYDIFPALAAKRQDRAGKLSGGQQQQLAIARALMAHPKLLLLDEPSEGIQPSVVAEIATLLGRVTVERGMGVILVEQNIEMALSIADRMAFIEHGRIVASEPVETVRARPELIESMLSI
jgi:urea ABC transporter ATP-binding protein UrtE